ncbi:tol-pal system-associated acyl-CoA thioesterase [Fusobacterium sp. CAG:439]|nr:tol-pal system-associated acyl-CoA thioesterase [Fusobacterium sp. CAG:439]HIT92662.1 acyl-CoA thioesterase [Candidatus Stercorousia faecigallinarum]
MKHIFETKVYYSDTDAYGVVWHGAYLRWLEKGRVDLCDALGLDLVTLKKSDILLPVTNMNVRYKASAKLNDTVIIETRIEKYNSLSVTFKQLIKSKETEKVFIEALFDVVAINEAGKLYRRLPEEIVQAFKKDDEKCPVCV